MWWTARINPFRPTTSGGEDRQQEQATFASLRKPFWYDQRENFGNKRATMHRTEIEGKNLETMHKESEEKDGAADYQEEHHCRAESIRDR